MSKIEKSKDLIRELAELLDQSTLSEIEVEDDGFRIRVAREVSAAPMSYAAPAAMAAPVAAPAPVAAVEAPVADASHPGAVTSPMVGTAYAAAGPDSDNFISEGAKVSEGDTLLIIEAMKVMNQIPAPKSGTVTKILFDNAEPVEFGQAQVTIE